MAVIGMRRSGKTTFLWQCLAERLAAGTPREALLCLNFEDERLVGLQATDLQWIVEEYFRLWPQFRETRRVTLFLDEIQVAAGWETFAGGSSTPSRWTSSCRARRPGCEPRWPQHAGPCHRNADPSVPSERRYAMPARSPPNPGVNSPKRRDRTLIAACGYLTAGSRRPKGWRLAIVSLSCQLRRRGSAA